MPDDLFNSNVGGLSHLEGKIGLHYSVFAYSLLAPKTIG